VFNCAFGYILFMPNLPESLITENLFTESLVGQDHDGKRFEIIDQREISKLPFEDDGFVRIHLAETQGDGSLAVNKPLRVTHLGRSYPKEDGKIQINVPVAKGGDVGLFNNSKGHGSPFTLYAARSKAGSRGDAYIVNLGMNATAREYDPNFGASAPDVSLSYDLERSSFDGLGGVQDRLKSSPRYQEIMDIYPGAKFIFDRKEGSKNWVGRVYLPSRPETNATIPLKSGDKIRIKTKSKPGLDEISGYTTINF